MRLIGMLDSPYVRRVAISLQLLDLRFEHESISVFRQFDAFAAINPVVKAPSLVCDDGEVLMDSTLILEYAESLATGRRSLMPAEPKRLQHALRVVSLALAACEKSVQIIYERSLRPEDKQHAPWIDRVTVQMLAALDALEAEVVRRSPAVDVNAIGQDGVTSAVVWQFIRLTSVAALVPPARFPALRALSESAERLPAFRAAPHGDGTYPVR
ncbi:MAG: glutathione S-transferase [Caldimonas sp.]